jgi:hypothetical protein
LILASEALNALAADAAFVRLQGAGMPTGCDGESSDARLQ